VGTKGIVRKTKHSTLQKGGDIMKERRTKHSRLLQGDVIDMLKTLPDESVNCVVTSPPY
jgi:DNA modification methylase